jgi:glyoxylase-like metal-dependent hydrolase (beta-lactamase superfamily II)/rhodanese-related sulfurtransferase
MLNAALLGHDTQVILKQFYLNCLAHASYVVADEQSGAAAVIDPQRDVDQYLTFAADHNLRITHVFLTHFHADFIAGHLELRDRVGATICLGRKAVAEYKFKPVGDGSTIDLGSVRIQVLETPGHTVESISLVVYDRESVADPGSRVPDPGPVAVLTGDTLFVGDVGRPDLRASLGWSATELGAMLYDSVHEKLLKLPDSTKVYPAHGAGSLCGKAISKETVSTIGEQRVLNYALQPMSKERFVELVTADQPDAPAYFTYDAVLNSRERPTLDQALARELKPLAVEQVAAAVRSGAQLLDTRDPSEFAAAHLAGSINIGLGGQYATWAGTLLDAARPIVIVADPGAEAQSALRLGRIGFDQVLGFLEGGLAAVEGGEPSLGEANGSRRPRGSALRVIVSTDRLSPQTAADRMAGASPPLVIDIRTPRERAEKSIKGSVHRPLNTLREGLPDVARDTAIVVHCAGGYRSSMAASLLQRDGFTNVSELAGGIAAWEAAGLPVNGSGQST